MAFTPEILKFSFTYRRKTGRHCRHAVHVNALDIFASAWISRFTETTIWPEIEKWLNDTIGVRGFQWNMTQCHNANYQQRITFSFLTEDHATIFKLTWC